jgi:hypothetical protein
MFLLDPGRSGHDRRKRKPGSMVRSRMIVLMIVWTRICLRMDGQFEDPGMRFSLGDGLGPHPGVGRDRNWITVCCSAPLYCGSGRSAELRCGSHDLPSGPGDICGRTAFSDSSRVPAGSSRFKRVQAKTNAFTVRTECVRVSSSVMQPVRGIGGPHRVRIRSARERASQRFQPLPPRQRATTTTSAPPSSDAPLP